MANKEEAQSGPFKCTWQNKPITDHLYPNLGKSERDRILKLGARFLGRNQETERSEKVQQDTLQTGTDEQATSNIKSRVQIGDFLNESVVAI